MTEAMAEIKEKLWLTIRQEMVLDYLVGRRRANASYSGETASAIATALRSRRFVTTEQGYRTCRQLQKMGLVERMDDYPQTGAVAWRASPRALSMERGQ